MNCRRCNAVLNKRTYPFVNQTWYGYAIYELYIENGKGFKRWVDELCDTCEKTISDANYILINLNENMKFKEVK